MKHGEEIKGHFKDLHEFTEPCEPNGKSSGLPITNRLYNIL